MDNQEKEKFEDEAQLFLNEWNHIFRLRLKSTASWITNYTFWRKYYDFDDLVDAARSASTEPFWASKITPTIFFRQKNPRGERVDYIEGFLSRIKVERQSQVQDIVMED